MGKKKSVVLMTLLTIVIVVLCALIALPSFPISGTIYKWEPIATNYDFSADLGGGYYTYYYPNGVISGTEYAQNLAGLENDGEQEEIDEYKNAYKQFGGLYLSTDVEDGVLDADGNVDETFAEQFDAFADEVAKRFEKKGYSDYRVAVVDNYSVRVEIPKSEANDQVMEVFGKLSMTGEVTLEIGDELVKEMKDDELTANDLIKSVSVGNRYKATYLKVQFTGKGKEMIRRVKSELSSQADQSSEGKTLDIKVGGTTVASIYQDAITYNNAEARPMAVDQAQGGYIKTYSILLNSALNNPLELKMSTTSAVSGSNICIFAPVYGKNVVTLLYIALGAILLATLIVPVVMMGKFGVVSGYGTLSYFIVAGICFKYITGGVFEFSLGTVLVFLAGLAVMNVIQMQIYNRIKKEAETGRALEASIKDGYKKTLWGIVDVYAVLLIIAVVLLFAGAGLFTMALQAIICIVTGAFCNLLWLRAINYMLFSASKNHFKYFRVVRRIDDDED